MSTTKITKKLKFEDVKRIINGEPTLFIDKQTALDFIDAELALLVKKNNKPKNPAKLTPKEIENNSYKDIIMDYIQNRGTAVTCSELREKIPDFAAFSPQKVVSLVCSLSKEGKLVKQTSNNIVYWAIVE